MIKHYRGWVPSVTGRLSFTHIGVTSHPKPCISENVADDSARFIISFQRRETLDHISPWKHQLAQLQGQHGIIWCACVAKSAKHNGRPMEMLSGRLFLFHSKDAWRKARPIIKCAQNNISGYRHLSHIDGPTGLKTHVAPVIDQLSLSLMELAGHHVQFKMLRSGEVDIKYSSDETVSIDAPKISTEDHHDFMLRAVTSQLFFFLKDISHEHQYHDPRTDTVIDLHDVTETNDINWREKTLYSLYRKIIEFKRSRASSMVVNSLGTLAYAKAFRGISSNILKDPPYYDDHALEASLEATHRRLTYADETTRKKRDKRNTLMFSFIGASFALASLMRAAGKSVTGEPSEFLKTGSYIVVNHTEIIVAIAFALAYYAAHPPEEWQFMRGLIRILQPQKRKVAIGTIALLGLITLAITYYLYLIV